MRIGSAWPKGIYVQIRGANTVGVRNNVYVSLCGFVCV